MFVLYDSKYSASGLTVGEKTDFQPWWDRHI